MHPGTAFTSGPFFTDSNTNQGLPVRAFSSTDGATYTGIQHLFVENPTTMFTKFEYINPVLPSGDINRDIAWYESKLGFKGIPNASTEPNAAPDYAVLGRQNLFIHLQLHSPADMANITGSVVRIQVDRVEPLFEEMVNRGSVGSDAFRPNTAWGTHEFGLYDLNKNALFFYEPAGRSGPADYAAATHPGKWFERPFDFEHLTTSRHGLLERLRDAPVRLAEHLRILSPDLLTRQTDGQWSIQEHIGHLLDLEPLWYGRVHDIVEGKTTMRPADLSNRKTHEAQHNATGISRLFRDFSAERAKTRCNMQ